jgi:hypothetical protein
VSAPHRDHFTVYCDCGTPAHVMLVDYDDFEPGYEFFDITLQVPRPGFWRRLWWATRYILKKDANLWGNWQATLFDKSVARAFANWILAKCDGRETGEDYFTVDEDGNRI